MRTLLLFILMVTAAVRGAVTGAIQNDATTKHVAQPPHFWTFQFTDAEWLDAVRKAQTNVVVIGGGITGAVASVNGQVGIVVLTTSDIAEGTNLYWTTARGSSMTNNPGFVVNLTALNSLSLSNGATLTNTVFDLGSGKSVRFHLGPGTGGNWDWVRAPSADHIRLTNSAANTWYDFNTSELVFGSGVNDKLWKISGVGSLGQSVLQGSLQANSFIGDGAGLTNLNAANMSGVVLKSGSLMSGDLNVGSFIQLTASSGEVVGTAFRGPADRALVATNMIGPLSYDSSTGGWTNGAGTTVLLASGLVIGSAVSGSVASSAVATSARNATNFWGQLSVTNFNGGLNASGSTVWTGDGTWSVPSGGSGTGIATNLGTGTNNTFTSPTIVSGTNVTDIRITSPGWSTVGLTNFSGALYIGTGNSKADVVAGAFWGDATHLTGLPAAQLTGTMPNTVFPAAVSNQLNLNATNLLATGSLPAANLSGTVNDARLSSNVPLLNALSNDFTGSIGRAGSAKFYGDGSQLSGLVSGVSVAVGTNGIQISTNGSVVTVSLSGAVSVLNVTTIYGTNISFQTAPTNATATVNTLATHNATGQIVSLANGGANTFLQGTTPPSYTSITDGALSSNVPLKNGANIFTASNAIPGRFEGSGILLTNLTAGQVVGTLQGSTVPTSVTNGAAWTAVANTFSATQTINGANGLNVGGSVTVTNGYFDPTNTVAANSSLTCGLVYNVDTSGTVTLGIPGTFNSVDVNSYSYADITFNNAGTATITNHPSIHMSDGLTSRVASNYCRINVMIIPRQRTNAFISQCP